MKKAVYTLILVMALGINYGMANTPVKHKPKISKVLTSQIYQMLGEYEVPNDIRGAKAEVRVAVDKGNYLRILSIETDNAQLDKYIRSAIDFERLAKGSFEQGVVYRIPIEVAKK
ncbi:hypothetical protein SAMN05421766_104641 [Zobellia uliginosa]|uniref:TonB protein C-terminal n=1 Tax=Zobellia uliginosa TaxID=143224 RepID=A0ABY1KX87_9FLAO|nr:hypothetical protein [Zobellia uliginosa]SIS88731.1 hypothetical protein SAMN05421766_104641 [Zobellia uliginosa]